MSTGVEVGDKAPDFTLPGIENGVRRDYTLSEYRGQKVVLAFYPGDDTPGCTRQMCSYRDEFSVFEGVQAVLLTIAASASVRRTIVIVSLVLWMRSMHVMPVSGYSGKTLFSAIIPFRRDAGGDVSTVSRRPRRA